MVNEAAEVAGHALQAAHKRKLDKSREPCNRQGIVFLPLAVESLGAWYPLAVKEVKKLASAKARHSRPLDCFKKLSVALQRGNAALFNNRVPQQSFHAKCPLERDSLCTIPKCSPIMHVNLTLKVQLHNNRFLFYSDKFKQLPGTCRRAVLSGH